MFPYNPIMVLSLCYTIESTVVINRWFLSFIGWIYGYWLGVQQFLFII